MSDERSVERDEKGRFITAHLSSDEAKRIGKLSYESKKGASRDTLLQEAGYKPEDAPEHLRLLAQMAAGRSGGAVSAMSAFIKLTVKPDRATEAGNTCQYASSCVLFEAYQGRASQEQAEAARARLAERE